MQSRTRRRYDTINMIKRFSRWARTGIAIVIILSLCWYLFTQRQQLIRLNRLNAGYIVLLHILVFSAGLPFAQTVKLTLSVLGAHTRFWDMVRLHFACVLLNYVPPKAGTLFRANYLKRHFGLSYAYFSSFFAYLTFLMTCITAWIGLFTILLGFGLQKYADWVAAAVFGGVASISLLLLVAPIPLPTGENRILSTLRAFISGRKEIVSHKRNMTASVILLTTSFLLTSARLLFVYRAIGITITPAESLLLGALGFVIAFLSLTPGSLGIRELVLTAGASILGIPTEIGVLAAMIDRAIMLSHTFIVGSACTLWIWGKDRTSQHPHTENIIKTE
jgi:uncharacterized membrane protein YbhN (UPF0104 family)